LLRFRRGGSDRATIGIAGAGAGAIGIISSPNDFIIYTNGYPFKVSTDTASSTAFSINTSGAVTLGPSGSSAVQRLNGEVLFQQAATSGSVRALTYYDGSSNTCGYVTIDATANTVTYANSSDARLKTNHRDFDGIGLVSKMKPSKYERICSPGADEIGLVAQELQAIMPEAVAVGGADADKNPWGVDYGRITPILIKAIQELKAELDVAKARIEALENP
jgi:hypothetical protein